MLDNNPPGLDAAPRVGIPRASIARRSLRSVIPCLWTALVSGTLVLLVAVLLPSLAAALAIGVLRHVDPPGSMLIWTQRWSGQAIDQRWVPLGAISPNLVRAVVASEDNQFCRHNGVDLREIEAAWERMEQIGDEGIRGGSTITMQVAKNLFLWNGRSYLRKAIEIPLAVGLEQLWPKHRIMEVYLNIAEWGPGVFGAEAAAQHHFRKPASRLTEREAALLAVALPNPHRRVASRPSPNLLKVAAVVERRAKLAAPRVACLLGE